MRQDCEASEGAVVAPWSGESNMVTRGRDAYHLSLLI